MSLDQGMGGQFIAKTEMTLSFHRRLEQLRKRHGGRRWRKLLLNGSIRRAEIHWYEAHGVRDDGSEDLEQRKLYHVLPDAKGELLKKPPRLAISPPSKSGNLSGLSAEGFTSRCSNRQHH